MLIKNPGSFHFTYFVGYLGVFKTSPCLRCTKLKARVLKWAGEQIFPMQEYADHR